MLTSLSSQSVCKTLQSGLPAAGLVTYSWPPAARHSRPPSSEKVNVLRRNVLFFPPVSPFLQAVFSSHSVARLFPLPFPFSIHRCSRSAPSFGVHLVPVRPPLQRLHCLVLLPDTKTGPSVIRNTSRPVSLQQNLHWPVALAAGRLRPWYHSQILACKTPQRDLDIPSASPTPSPVSFPNHDVHLLADFGFFI